ncbi:MAG: hypothetical protein JWL92_138, partial [Candidatus Nomurabacteria bacterium]|nr:hypothetical protein [Candidatus Nomurabacteria bacterium]
ANSVAGARVSGVFTSHTTGAVSADIAFSTMSAGTMAEKMRILANGNISLTGASITSAQNLVISGSGITTIGSGNDIQTSNNGYFSLNTSGSGSRLVTTSLPFGTSTLTLVSKSGSGGVLIGNRNYVQFSAHTTNGTERSMGDIGFVWTGVTDGSQSSAYTVKASNNGTVGEVFRVTGSGNVGIGTNAPVSLLDVTNTQTAGVDMLTIRDVTGNRGLKLGTNNANGNAVIQSYGISDNAPQPLYLNPTLSGGNPVGVAIGGINIASSSVLTLNTGNANTFPLVITRPNSGTTAAWFSVDSSANVIFGTNNATLDFRTVTNGTVSALFLNTNGNVGIGTVTPSGILSIAGNRTAVAWGTNGINLQTAAATYTDSSTAISGTATNNMVNTFGVPTLAATNTLVTYTNAATVYIAGAPVAGTNVTLTNKAALVVASGNVGIGTTSPTAQLTLQATASAAPRILILDGSGAELLRIASDNLTDIFIGKNAGINTISPAAQNIFIGALAGQSNTTGSFNTAIGNAVLQNNQTAGFNVGMGANVLTALTTGGSNTGVGTGVFQALTNGTGNTAVGNVAMQQHTTGSYNTVLGNTAFFNAGGTSGSYNIVIGAWSNPASLTGSGQLNIGNVIYGTGMYQTASNSSTPTATGAIGIGTNATTSVLTIGGSRSATAWGANGINLQTAVATYTDSSSSGTVPLVTINSFGPPTLTASSPTTYSKASNVFIDGITAGTNVTLSNSYGLEVAGGFLADGPVLNSITSFRSTGHVTINGGTDGGYNLDVNGTLHIVGVTTLAGTLNAPTIVASNISSPSNNLAVELGSNGGLFLNGLNFLTGAGQAPGKIFMGNPIGTGGVTEFHFRYTTGADAYSVDMATGRMAIGNIPTQSGLLTIGGSQTAAAWGTAGINLRTLAATYTDSSSTTGTIVNNAVNSFGIPTLAAANTGIIYTNPATVYIAGAPVAGTNVTNTNPLALYVAGGNSSFAGRVGISNTAPGFLLHVGSTAIPDATVVARFESVGAHCDITASTTGGIVCTSDMNLKKNITPISFGVSSWSYNTNITFDNQSVLSKILALSPVQYNLKTEQDSTTKHAGFIAQEVRQVFPDLISADAATGTLSMNYTGLVPYTIAAIQEMNLNITSISDLTHPNTWRTALTAWFANNTNGIGDFVANRFRAKNEICINNTCVTEQQLQQVLQNSHSSGSTTVINPPPVQTSEATPPPVVENPIPEVIPDPVPEAPVDTGSDAQSSVE